MVDAPKFDAPIPGMSLTTEVGKPLTSIANTIQMNSVMQGIHSVDSGILALPVIMEMMLITVEAAGIEYNSGMEEDTSNKPMSTELLLSKLKGFSTEQMNEEPEDMPMPVMEPDMGGGLMSRRQ